MRRSLLALLLTVVALGVPSVAWYIVGSREAARRAAEIESIPLRQAGETAAQLAGRLADRLETLRQAEDRRPFFHYQSLYHDPRGAYEGASVIPSPLVEGPTDPLVLAHFQLDPTGRVSLPAQSQSELQAQLQPVLPASGCVASLRQVPAMARARPQKLEVLDRDAYAQNIAAPQLYEELKMSKSARRDVNRLAAAAPADSVAIKVGSLQWCSLALAGKPALAALRDVITPEGVNIQGFVLSSAAIADSFVGAALPVRFAPEPSSQPNEVSEPVGTTGWHVIVDAADAWASAHLRSERNSLSFRQAFWTGIGAASVAGLCVVLLVWHTERLARQRSQFAAAAAHELRTPLSGLRMYSEMLAEGLGDPSKAKTYARHVATEAERLGRVVGNVLGFTRLERGRLHVQPAAGDLAAFVRECVAQQNGNIQCAIPENLPAVKFDRDAVTQILQNLLDNAEKHTRQASDRTIHVALAAQNGAVTLSVRDHGAGIPREMRRHLFQPFRRGSDSDAAPGIGLGLVLVKALAEAQGARVSYRDAEGGGAEFTVTFPA